jgi:hypothetical protein
MPGTLDAGVIDRAGTITIGATSGTSITVGRSAQVVTMPGTLDAGVIDRAGTIAIGATSGTSITVGRSGQTVTLPGTLNAAVIDRAGTITIGATSGTSITVGRSGQNLTLPGNVLGVAYDVAIFFPSKPSGSQVIARIVATRGFSLPSSFTTSRASAIAAATASTVFDIQKNGSSIGSATFAASATTATFSGTGGSFAAGDVLAIVAPASADATLADISFTLAGTRV